MNINTYNSLPNNILAYWVSNNFLNIFSKSKPLSEYGDSKQGLATADNNRFLRLRYEVNISCECFDATDMINAFALGKKWFPYNKGGKYRKWYGNQDFVVNWENNGKEIRNIEKNGKISSVVRNSQYYFQQSISWSKISSGSIAFRYYPKGFLFDVAGCSIFIDNDLNRNYIHGLLNSNLAQYVLKILSPTLNYEVGQISSLPIIFSSSIKCIVNQKVEYIKNISKSEWDSFELSWNFKKHPLI